MDLIIGRRVLKNGLVLATTIATCTMLQANDQQSASSLDNAGGPQSSATGTAKGGNLGDSADRQSQYGQGGQTSQSGQAQSGQHDQKQQKFVQKAMKSGQMEVQMGQMAQQNGQNQEVKALGQRLVQDHTQANQQLQQIAQTLKIQSSDAQSPGQPADAQGDHAKHQQAMSKLQGKSGAEFDREFTKMAIKHHRKDIQEFERAQSEVNDAQLKSFVQQTLPKLRQHLQMAQAAARSLGIDESSIAADESDPNATKATGAPAASESGAAERSNPDLQPQSPDTDRQSAIEHDTHGADDRSSISGGAQVGGSSVGGAASVDVDRNSSASVDLDPSTDHDIDVDADADLDAETEDGNKLFRKGDGKVLGLPTSKTDGKILGILPAPGGNDDADVEVEADADLDTDASSVGGAARSESGQATDRDVEVDADIDVDKK
jgi:putative membrane protein